MLNRELYSTIILDLGGVLINVDYHASARAFAEWGFREFDALYSSKRPANHIL